MRIPAYCSFSFLKNLTEKPIVALPEKSTVNRIHLELLELIAEGLQITTDTSKEKIADSYNNPYILYLIKNNRLETSEEHFIELGDNSDQCFEKDKKYIRLYLLSDFYKTQINDLECKSGYHFITEVADASLLFEEEIETFRRTLRKTWQFSIRFLKPHHSIVIAAPYLFKESSAQALCKLFSFVAPKELKGTYHVTLIGSDNRRGLNLSPTMVKQSILAIENELSRYPFKLCLEYHIYNNEEFHNRAIVTNNNFIFLGYELDLISGDDQVKKEDTWIAVKPFMRGNLNGQKGVLYYTLLREKLAIYKGWIQNSDKPTTSNPLFI